MRFISLLLASLKKLYKPANMKFVFISELIGASWGGSELLWSQAAKELLSQGHQVLISVNHCQNFPEPILELKRQGAEVLERKWIQSPLVQRTWQRLTFRSVTHPGWEPAWSVIEKFRPDLLCISNGGVFCGLYWMNRCLESGIPYVNIAQSNSESEGAWPSNDLLPVVRRVLSKALRAFFVSQANLRLFERQIAMRLPNAEVVANPFAVDWESKIPWPDEKGGLRLACVARLEPHAKGQDLLIEVLSAAKWRNRNLSVTLYGNGRHSELVRELVKLEQLQDRVRFGGHVARVEDIWAEHHALVLPSRYEGLPLAIVEAMICGRPVITTDVSGNAEFLEDNLTAFIARTATLHDLDEAMERAWNMRESWKIMGSVAAQAIRQKVPRNPARIFADKLLKILQA
jgi:glycosyltransferase involved in cell wall biosynthesis